MLVVPYMRCGDHMGPQKKGTKRAGELCFSGLGTGNFLVQNLPASTYVPQNDPRDVAIVLRFRRAVRELALCEGSGGFAAPEAASGNRATTSCRIC